MLLSRPVETAFVKIKLVPTVQLARLVIIKINLNCVENKMKKPLMFGRRKAGCSGHATLRINITILRTLKGVILNYYEWRANDQWF